MKIQISKIHPNPNNPRHVFNQAEDDSLALSMQKQGQLVACVVKQITPDSFQLISGSRRLRAAKKNNWTELECDIEDKSEGDEAIELMLFNGGKPLFWLEKYVGIEYARSKNPGMTGKELAVRLGETETRVSCANKVLPLLNKAARDAIICEANLSTGYEVSEKAILALSSFAMGGQDDIDLMERAIRVLIAGKMTEKQAKKLAEWVKDGNSPEDFAGSNAQKAKSSKEDGDGQDGPYARQWQELKETGYFQIKGPSKGSIHIIIPDEGSGVAAAFGAAGAIWALRQAHSPEQSRRAQGDAGSGQAFFEGNPYWADLPGLVDAIKENKSLVSSSKFPGKGQGKDSNSGLETINQKPETSINRPMTMLKGMLNQQVTTASNDPIDQLKAKALNAGMDLGKKGVNWLLKKIKKDI